MNPAQCCGYARAHGIKLISALLDEDRRQMQPAYASARVCKSLDRHAKIAHGVTFIRIHTQRDDQRRRREARDFGQRDREGLQPRQL